MSPSMFDPEDDVPDAEPDFEFGGHLDPQKQYLPNPLTQPVTNARGWIKLLGLEANGQVTGSPKSAVILAAMACVIIAGVIWLSNAVAGAVVMAVIVVLVVLYIATSRPKDD